MPTPATADFAAAAISGSKRAISSSITSARNRKLPLFQRKRSAMYVPAISASGFSTKASIASAAPPLVSRRDGCSRSRSRDRSG